MLKIKGILLTFAILLMSTINLIGEEAAVKEEHQKPINLTPGLSIGWNYASDHSLGVTPSLDLSFDTKSGTGRNINLSAHGECGYTEYLFEEGVESSSDIRELSFGANASISSDFTSKIKGSFGVQSSIGVGNTYENASSDSKWMDATPKLTFKAAEKTSISTFYTFDIYSSNNPYMYNSSGNEGPLDDTLSTLRDRGAFPTSIYDPDYPSSSYGTYYQTLFGPPNYAQGDTTDTVDYKQYAGISLSHGFAETMAPTLKGGYNLVFNRDSNNDGRDLWLSHVIKAGLSQPMWKNATFDLGWKFDIKNWDSTYSTDQSEYKQDVLNRTDLSISQGINDFVSLSFSYRNDYYFGNTREKATIEHSGGASLSFTF